MRMYAGALLLSFLSFTGTAHAHDIFTNGTATLLVHFAPDDITEAHKETTIELDLVNSMSGFSLSACDCQIKIGRDDSFIYKGMLESAETEREYNLKGIPFIFPAVGTYMLSVEGEPKVAGQFAPFRIEAPVEISAFNAGLSAHSHTHPHPILELSMYLVFTLYMGWCLFTGNKKSNVQSDSDTMQV